MSFFGDLFVSLFRRGHTATAPPRRTGEPAGRAGRLDTPTEPSKGQFGPSATVEVDPRTIGRITMTYTPSTDGNPDPGEVIWTWVPFEERDGRGKDRPVVIVALEPKGSVLAVQLTSKAPTGDRGFVSLGSGPWDAEGRPSWLKIDRVLRVFPDGMRREAAALDRARYDLVKKALQARYGWR